MLKGERRLEKIKKSMCVCVILLLAMMSLACVSVIKEVSAVETKLELNPKKIRIAESHNFNITLDIQDVKNLSYINVAITYWNEKMEFKDCWKGAFIKEWANFSYREQWFFGGTAEIRILADGASKSGSGTLAKIEFHCKKGGTVSVIQIDKESELRDDWGEKIAYTKGDDVVVYQLKIGELPFVGGKATPIIKPELQISLIWLTIIIIPIVATALYVKFKKKKQ